MIIRHKISIDIKAIHWILLKLNFIRTIQSKSTQAIGTLNVSSTLRVVNNGKFTQSDVIKRHTVCTKL